MSVEINLNNLHIFPSKESYESNKDSLTQNDLALIPRENILEKWMNPSGMKGNSVVRVGESKFDYSELIIMKKIVTNSSELETEKGGKDSVEEMFNTYTLGVIHNKSPVNFDTVNLGSQANQWIYNPTYKAVDCNVNSSEYGCFISPSNFNNYSITLYATASSGNDDDLISFIASAYLDDTDGQLHSLAVVRTNGGIQPNYGLIMDYDTSKETNGKAIRIDLLNNNSLVDTTSGKSWGTYPQRLQVSRIGDTIEFITSNNYNGSPTKDALVESTKVTYTLPKTKPEELTDRQFEILTNLLTKPTKIGYGCYSQNIRFKIESERGILPDNTIYDIKTMKKYTLNPETNEYVESGSFDTSDLLPNSLIFNPSTKRLIYRDRGGKFYTLK